MLNYNSSQITRLAQQVANLGGNLGSIAREELQVGAEVFKADWGNLLAGAEIEGVQGQKRGLSHQRIKNIKIEHEGHAVSVSTTDPVISIIERGRNAYDMKDTHPFGPKSRINKKGEPYNIIPFRKGQSSTTRTPIPSALQRHIDAVKKAGWEPSYALGPEHNYQSPNARGEMVTRTKTKWGDRIDLNPRPFRDKTAKYSGLYRLIDAPFNKTADYGIVSFRIIKQANLAGLTGKDRKAAAAKWINPAVAGKHYVPKLAKIHLSGLSLAIQAALNNEIKALTQGGRQ